jgi:ADP-ribose pyrophosphatase
MAAKTRDFVLVKERDILQAHVFKVRHENWHCSTGQSFERDTIVHGGAVAILPFDHKGRVLMIRQFRPAIREWLLEIPAGTLDHGETPLACAKRELIEETGFSAKLWKKLGAIFTAPGFCTEKIHLFAASQLKPGHAEQDEDEFIELQPMSLAQLRRAIRSGLVHDSKTLCALTLFGQL